MVEGKDLNKKLTSCRQNEKKETKQRKKDLNRFFLLTLAILTQQSLRYIENQHFRHLIYYNR